MLGNSRRSTFVAALLVTLALLPMLPAGLTAETEPRPAEIVPAKHTGAELPPKENERPKKPANNKLVIEKPTPKRPAPEPAPKRPAPEKPAPEKPARAPAPREPVPEKPVPEKPVPEKQTSKEPAPDAERGEGLKRAVRAGATVVPVLPGPARKAPKKAPERRPPAAKQEKPRDNRLALTVPRLGLEDVPVGDSPEQAYLDREGIMHLSGTGFPFERGSNTYIAGHAADYDASRVPNVFRNLYTVRQGDLIALRDSTGKVYKYRVTERLVVNPRDVWVTDPIPGKQIVSLQTCYPAPTFEKRLIVRGQLIS